MAVPSLLTRLDSEQMLTVRDLGMADYQTVWNLQKHYVAQRHANAIADTLLLVEHEPVYTVGRAYQTSHLLADVPVIEVERGGDITYHGPGQLVAYPIVHLKARGLQVVDFVRQLEQIVIATLAQLGLPSQTHPGKTGVWLGQQKVASIGIAVRHWITFHGLAINVDMAPQAFAAIRPCGFAAQVMTDVQSHSSHPIEIKTVKTILTACFDHALRS